MNKILAIITWSNWKIINANFHGAGDKPLIDMISPILTVTNSLLFDLDD